MEKKLRIFTDFSTLTDSNLKNLSPMFSFHWNGLGLDSIFAGENNPSSPFILSKPAEADFVALPMHWTCYLWNQKARMAEAAELSKVAKDSGKQLIIWFKGDLVPKIPFDNVVLFLPGLVRTAVKVNQLACPVFVEDPEPLWSSGKNLVRRKSDKPSVGFCGYGSLSNIKLLWSIFGGVKLNAYNLLGRFDYEAIPIVPATLLRNRALKFLANDPRIKSDFLILENYTSKMNTGEAKLTDSANRFFTNIYETDYTLCVRGFGNWSYRFYETLACGRIPVFIDSDCALPLSSKIDWRRYSVWVDQSELHLVGENLLDFHSSLSASDFENLQIECRKLWQEQLSLQGCMENIRSYLEESLPPCHPL